MVSATDRDPTDITDFGCMATAYIHRGGRQKQVARSLLSPAEKLVSSTALAGGETCLSLCIQLLHRSECWYAALHMLVSLNALCALLH